MPDETLVVELQDGLKVTGELTVEVHDAETGELLRSETVRNLVVTAGKNLIRDLIGGATSAYPTHFAVGTSSTAPAAGDTALGVEVFRDQITQRVYSAVQVTVKFYLATGYANGNTLREAGIFNAAAAGTMLSRAVYSAIAKTSSITVTYTWNITVS
jgi:hypothetical protein